jgi:hypothetical protein
MNSTRHDPISTARPAPRKQASLDHAPWPVQGTRRGLWGAVGGLLLASTLALSPWESTPAFAALDSTDTATGTGALAHEDGGADNTADGNGALASNTTGSFNTAVGVSVLYSNTTGAGNTAEGNGALYSNTTGSANTANGGTALYSNKTGADNTATGFRALYSSTTGSGNTVSGGSALFSTTTGSDNTASGESALYSNVTGTLNMAAGSFALFKNTTGSNNTAVGPNSLYSNTTGSSNTSIGSRAGDTDGAFANTTGSNNTFLGSQTGPATNTELTNATAIGWNARVGESNALVLGGTGSDAIKVGIGTTTPGSSLTVAGTIESTSGGIKFPDGSVQTRASTLASSPGAAGNVLRSNGSSWSSAALVAGDLPAGSTRYLQNTRTPQADTSFNIVGDGVLSGTLTVAGKAGVGRVTPNSLLQLGTPGKKYGTYLQLPLVTNEHAPPAAQCNATSFVGRVVMQYNPKSKSATLLLCSSDGKWVAVH